MERLHILDGFGYIFRAYYGMATAGRNRGGVRLSNAEGLPTGALYVYASMLIRLHEEERPERIVVVFDEPGKNFRDELDPQYKATRRETPDDLKAQLPYFRPLTEAFCWPVISVGGVEADDTIATIAGQARDRDWEVVIYSGDKDLMQLVDDHITVVDSMRHITYDRNRVIEKFGVPPELLGDWLALVGDKSDNVPGMVGVGKVGATKLLTAYGSLGGILSNVDELKGKQKERFCDAGNIAQLEMSKKLVTLKTDVELPRDLDSFMPRTWDSGDLLELCRRFEFSGLLERLGGRVTVTEDDGVERVAALEPLPEVSVELFEAEVATDASMISSMAAAAREAGRLAVHIEGDGSRHDRERLVALCVAVPGRKPLYVPVAHRYLGAPKAVSSEQLLPLAEVLADPEIRITCHDSKTLRKILKREGIGLAGVSMDILLATYLLGPETDSHKLPDALREAVGIAVPSRDTLVGKGKKSVSWELVEVGHASTYLAPVVCGLLEADEVLNARLSQAGMSSLFHELELPLAQVLADLEMRGILLDEGVLTEIREEVGTRIAAIENKVFDIVGSPFNIGSPKQLSKLLFETLGLRSEVMKKTKTGFSTDHEVLEAMVDTHEIISPILEHRELVKLKGTYVDALPPLVNRNTHRLHTSFRQDVAATGRLSSQDPNLQNIPIRTEMGRSIRRAFVAPEGKKLVSADYSQIELRIMAHLSEDPVLIRAFNDGIDVHSQTASEVFDLPLSEVGATERRVAKAVNYGLIYGQSEFGLGRALGIPRKEARHYITKYFERFAKVRSFMDDIVNKARKAGAAYTVCGRMRPIPGLSAKNFRVRSAAERIAQNTPMQGSAADIMKLAMLRVDVLLRDSDVDAQMLLTVHDELIIEVAADHADSLGKQLRSAMEGAYELRVPLVVDIGVADSWADAH